MTLPTTTPGIAVASSDALLEAPLAAIDVARFLEDGGMRLLAQTDDTVLAECPVAGEPQLFRRVAAQLRGTEGWRVGYLIACVGQNSEQIREHALVASRVVRDLRELGLFVGGMHATPITQREVVAIEAGPRVAWCTGHGWSEWHREAPDGLTGCVKEIPRTGRVSRAAGAERIPRELCRACWPVPTTFTLHTLS